MAVNGAVIAGRGSCEAAGALGRREPLAHPVLYRHPPPCRPAAGRRLHFVASVAKAIDRAQAAADGRRVHVMGGGGLIGQVNLRYRPTPA
jgi:dihydrofolate reductase